MTLPLFSKFFVDYIYLQQNIMTHNWTLTALISYVDVLHKLFEINIHLLF